MRGGEERDELGGRSMGIASDGNGEAGGSLLSPSRFAETMPDPAKSACLRDRPGGCSIQMFSRIPPVVDIPGLQTNVLVGHLAGPYYVETGRSAHRGDRRWISQGQVGVTPAGSPVYRSFKGKPQIALIHLDPNMIHSIAADVFRRDPARVHLVPKLAETDETASRLIRLLLREAEQPWMTGSDLVIDDLSRTLAIHTLRFHSNLSTQAPEARAQLTPARMRRVVDYMEANLDQPLSVAGLASVGELSPSHFGRAFRDATGRSPHRFLTVLRIARARELLTTTKLPITEIGLRCGFAHPSHFATIFRRTTGLTPRDWRSLAE